MMQKYQETHTSAVNSSNYYPLCLEYRLRRCLSTDDYDLVKTTADEFFQELILQTNGDYSLLKSWLIQALIVFYHKAWQIGVPLKKILTGIDRLFEKIEIDTTDKTEEDHLFSMYNNLISNLMTITEDSMNAERLIDKVKCFIQAQFHRKLSLKEVAEALQVEQALLRSIITQEIGMDFYDYLLRIRINEAKKMLAQTDCSVSEIALQVGFQDSGYFIKKFKRLEGITPGKYLKSKRCNTNVIDLEGQLNGEGIEEHRFSEKELMQIERDIWVALLGGNMEVALKLVELLLENIYQEYQNLGYLKAYSLKMITVFFRKCIQIGIPAEGVLYNMFLLKRMVFTFTSVREVNLFVHEIMRNILERIRFHYHSSSITAVEKVKKYIQHNYSYPIQINELADLVNFSTFHLTRLFFKQTGITLHGYITQIRLEEAKRLICATDYSIEQIAERVGYQDSSYFITLFKKKVGQTPRKYAASVLNIKRRQ